MQKKIIAMVLVFFIVVIALLVYMIMTISPMTLKRDSFTFELGEDISTKVQDYVNANDSILDDIQLDLSQVSKEVGRYKAKVSYYGMTEDFEIKIVDTIKPKAKLKQVQFEMKLGAEVKAADLIETVEDNSQTSVYFYDEKSGQKSESKVYSSYGSYVERIIVIDQHGNQSSALRVKIVVAKNEVPPVIEGVKDQTIRLGEKIDLKKGIKATDDEEGDITSRLVIKGEVNIYRSGEYEVTYTVKDKADNTATVVRKVTVVKK